MTRPGVAWIGVAILLAACALAGWALPREAIDWQPGLAAREPWRMVTAVGVHYSAAHLLGNLGGVVLTAALGWVARVPMAIALAWLAAWPLTQAGLLLQPALLHYGGLSGVLHAGVAAAAVALLWTGVRAQRIVAGLLFAGLVAKVCSETPWDPALRPSTFLGIAVAPLAHATGAIAGAACAIIALLSTRPRPHD